MILLTKDNMQNAIAKAKKLHPFVMFLGERQFAVESKTTLETYRIRFFVKDGKKLGSCTCKAGQAGVPCYHLAAASQANLIIQAMRKAANNQ